jgi:hypothetical protein
LEGTDEGAERWGQTVRIIFIRHRMIDRFTNRRTNNFEREFAQRPSMIGKNMLLRRKKSKVLVKKIS